MTPSECAIWPKIECLQGFCSAVPQTFNKNCTLQHTVFFGSCFYFDVAVYLTVQVTTFKTSCNWWLDEFCLMMSCEQHANKVLINDSNKRKCLFWIHRVWGNSLNASSGSCIQLPPLLRWRHQAYFSAQPDKQEATFTSPALLLKFLKAKRQKWNLILLFFCIEQTVLVSLCWLTIKSGV